MRGGNSEVVAEPEILVYADQDLLQFDDLRLELDPRNVVTTRVGLTELAICTVVCGLHLRGCITNKVVFLITVMPGSLVEAPSYMATNRLDYVRVRISTVLAGPMFLFLCFVLVIFTTGLLLQSMIQVLRRSKDVRQHAYERRNEDAVFEYILMQVSLVSVIVGACLTGSTAASASSFMVKVMSIICAIRVE